MGRDIIARGMASGAIKVNINAGHVFVDNTARDAYFVTNPTELAENMYVYCDSKLQQYDGSTWVDRTPAIKGERGTGVPTGGTTNQVLTKNSNGDYDFSWIDLAGGGDMVKSFYDTANKQVDVYDMDNMEDGTTYVRTENNYDDIDKAKVDALDLDTLVPYTGADKNVDLGSNSISANTIGLKTDYVPTGLEPVGSIYYNSENVCLSTVLPNGVTLENGQEMHVPILNRTGATITNGSVVYINGAIGNSNSLTGDLFIADGSINSSLVAGIATHDILDDNEEKGKITCFGLVRGIDTTGAPYGETWEEDDVIYASPTIAGGITNVAPQAPNLTVILGYVVNKHTNGLLSIKLNSGAKLTDLHDVNGTPLTTDGQIMVWDDSRQVFDFDYNINDYKLNDVKSGTSVSISDAEDNVYFNNIVINGSTTQKTYDGVQMLDVTLTYLKTINTTGSWVNNIYTLNGLNYEIITNQNDCVMEVKVSGVGTLNTNFYIRAAGTPINAGSYWIKGCPVGGMTDSYWLRLVLGGSLNRNDIGAGLAVTPATNTTYECYIRIYPNITMNHSFYPMLSLESNKLHIYEPFTGNAPSPSINYPEPLTPIGRIGNLVNLNINSMEIPIQLNSTLYNTDKLSIYNKEVCDNFEIDYNPIYENNVGVFKFSKTIASYSGQTIVGDYDSSTNGLDTGATIVYYNDGLPEFVPLEYSQQEIYRNLKQVNLMTISTEDLATLNIYYNKTNYTIKTLFENINILKRTKQDIIFIDDTITSQKFNEMLKNSSKFKTFYLLEGAYSLKQLRLKSNTHIILDKNAVINVADNSHLFFNFELTDTDVLKYNGQGNITIEGGTINGHVASFIHGYDITFKNIKVNNCPRDHYFEINSCKNVTIEDCVFNGMIEKAVDRQYVEYIQIEQAKRDAFPHLGDVNSPTFDNTPSTNIKIYGNEFDKGTDTFAYAYAAIGSHVSSPQYLGLILIEKNKFYNFTWGAISMRSWEQVEIEDNYFENCKTTAYFKYGNKNIQYEHNKVYNCESAIYLYNGTLSSMNNLNIDNNHFDGCLHRINCEIAEGVETIVNGGKIFDTNNYIENSGTDIIIGKEFYMSDGNIYKSINEKVGYVLSLDTVSNIIINGSKFEDIQLDADEETYNICKVSNSYEKLSIKNNIYDNTKLYDAVNSSDEFIFSGDKFTLNKTLLTTSWSETSPYTLELDVTTNGTTINENNFNLNIYPQYSTNVTTAKSEMEAYSYVSRADILTNNIVTFTCYDFKPTTNISLKIELENK